MRRVLALVPFLLALPLAPAGASSCVAAAEPPHLVVGANGIHARGAFGCADAGHALTVTVCVEEQQANGVWLSHGCATSAPVDGRTATGEVVIGVLNYGTILRAVATGTDAEGDTAAAKSAPVLWVNCACIL